METTQSTSVNTPDKHYLSSISALKKEIKARGLYKKDTKIVLLHLCMHLICTAAGITLFILSSHLLLALLATALLLVGLLGIGTHTHNSAHYASTNSKKLDNLLSYFGDVVILGFSVNYWQYKHNIVHHKNPNIVGHDFDFDFAPFFTVIKNEKENTPGLHGFYYRYLQGIIFPIVIGFLAFDIQRQGLAYLLGKMRKDRTEIRYFADLGCHILHIFLWIVLPSLWFEMTDVLLFYLLRNMLLSYALFFTLGASHLVPEAVFAAKDQSSADFFLKQTATTINIQTNRYGKFLMSGLDYQIEHHLFVGVCYTKLPKLSTLVKEYCEVNGYSHTTLGMLPSWLKVIGVFYVSKPVINDLELSRPLLKHRLPT
ncbi:MAG: fatty acid desaturase [Methylobacter sp.]|nr:fatty acid desaturase [Methylobacter sp.]